MTIRLTIPQNAVYEEVKITTSYTGAKSNDAQGAYTQIRTTTSDQETALTRFWFEATSEVTSLLKPFLISYSLEADGGEGYTAELEMPSNFDPNLTGSIETSLRSYFVDSITASWFRYCNRNDVQSYEHSAEAALIDARAKLYHRTKPRRPSFNQ